jgi:hypothetical protein
MSNQAKEETVTVRQLRTGWAQIKRRVALFEDAAEEARKLLSGLLQPVLLNYFLWLEMRNADIRQRSG